MSANSRMQGAARDALDDARDFRSDALRAAEHAQKAFPEFAKQARDVFETSVDQFRGQFRDQGREAADVAGEQLENARLYVVDRVHERPLTTTLAAAGVGFLIGVLLASGGRR